MSLLAKWREIQAEDTESKATAIIWVAFEVRVFKV